MHNFYRLANLTADLSLWIHDWEDFRSRCGVDRDPHPTESEALSKLVSKLKSLASEVEAWELEQCFQEGSLRMKSGESYRLISNLVSGDEGFHYQVNKKPYGEPQDSTVVVDHIEVFDRLGSYWFRVFLDDGQRIEVNSRFVAEAEPMPSTVAGRS